MEKKRGSKRKTSKSRKTNRNTDRNALQQEVNIQKAEEKELQELENLKKDVEKKSGFHPLTKVTRADIVRSIIGALIGTVGHFAFFYGAELAERISMVRATSLYVLSVVVCFLFMYYSGFRKVKEIRIFRFIPLRVGIVYITSILVVMGTLFVFGIIDFHTTFNEAYKTVATTLLLAVLGACTADILGKE